jgi:hypothetical protein
MGEDIIIQHRGLKRGAEGHEFEGYGQEHNWTHISFLWELPYAKVLILPHNIDLMHQEHNVAESIISMCLNIKDKTKDKNRCRLNSSVNRRTYVRSSAYYIKFDGLPPTFFNYSFV